MKCLRLIGRQESSQLSYKNHLFYPFVIESLYLKCFVYLQQKDVLDLCPRYFDEILQVLELKTQTKAASRARTGCGSNQ